jgi:hypothetical protein
MNTQYKISKIFTKFNSMKNPVVFLMLLTATTLFAHTTPTRSFGSPKRSYPNHSNNFVAGVIDAVLDSFPTVTSGTTPIVIGSVLTNDTLDGVPVATTNTNVTPTTSGPLSVDANGILTLAANAPSGTYVITYQICESDTSDIDIIPANCDTATATVVVANVIDAVNELPVTMQSSFGSSPTIVLCNTSGNVTENDTINGMLITATNSNVVPIVSTPSQPLSIDAIGTITLLPNTPSGTYTITYIICEANPATGLNVVPANCDTAFATVNVLNIIDAVNDAPVTLSVGTTPVVVPGNVTTNDTLNGIPITSSNTNVNSISTGPLWVDPNGSITLAPNTPSGFYTITYTICEANPATGAQVVPANCDTSTATVVVVNVIDAVNDGTTTVPYAIVAAGSTLLNSVIANDTLNGNLVTNTNINVNPTPALLTMPGIDTNGFIFVAPGTPTGVYTVAYTLCEANPFTGNDIVPPNCDTATATVEVIGTLTFTSDGTYVDTNADGVTNPGDEIQYAIVLNNSGTTALNNITITDVNATVSGSLATLAAGATDSTSFTAVHVITATNIAAAQVNNLATISINGVTAGNATDPTLCTSCNAVAGCTSCSSTPINRIGGGLTNIISGKLRLDYDQNGCSTTDPIVSYQKVQMSYGTDMVETFTNTTGDYSFYAGVGTFTVSPILTNPAYVSSTPVSQAITFSTNNNTTLTQDFCINPAPATKDLYISMYPQNNARPGFHAYYYIVYRNDGTLPVTQTNGVTLNFDDSKMDFVSATAAPSTQATGVLQWSFVNLLPGETRYIYVDMLINAPTATVPVNIGNVLPYSVNIIPTAGDINVANNSMVFNQMVVGSYDPNQVTCIEGAILPPSEIGKNLHYAIDFENTGNFPAEFIVVKIDVNPADYDLSSLQLEYASHAVETKIIGNRVEFFFKNINLAGPGGHGHILLRIKSNNTLLAGDSVTKNASIFFDYNAPILTNDATTVYNVLKNNQFEIDNSIAIAPNPTTGKIKINCNNTIKMIEVYDVQGRILETVLNANSIDISDKSNGIYFLKITTEIGSKIEKVVRE